MRKVAKLMGISLLALGLAACDGNTKRHQGSARRRGGQRTGRAAGEPAGR